MTKSNLCVHFGCGFHAPDGWLNYDYSPTLRFERIPILGHLFTKNVQRFPANVHYGNIVRGLPLLSGRCKALYASHVLEHLSLSGLREALANCYNLLGKNGIFRMIVPDLEGMVRKYIQDLESGDSEAAARFVQASGLGQREPPAGSWGLLKAALGNSRHRWMWDWAGLSVELKRTGFAAIRRCSFGDCEDTAFRAVEDIDRFKGCLAVECRKPADH